MDSYIKSKFILALFGTTSLANAADCTAAGATLWESNPSEDLSELPPLFETVAGQADGIMAQQLAEAACLGWVRARRLLAVA